MRTGLLGGLLLLAGCDRSSAVPYIRDSGLTPVWLTARQARAPGMHRVGGFQLLDQHGAPVTEQALRGRLTVVQFFFASCRDVCPTTTGGLARLLLRQPNPLVQVLSYSVRPAEDSVAALRRYAELHRLEDARWHLLTGTASQVERLARESYFVRLGQDSTYGVKAIAHTESLVLVDGEGRLRGVYAGSLPLELERLSEDLETLLAETQR